MHAPCIARHATHGAPQETVTSMLETLGHPGAVVDFLKVDIESGAFLKAIGIYPLEWGGGQPDKSLRCKPEPFPSPCNSLPPNQLSVLKDSGGGGQPSFGSFIP